MKKIILFGTAFVLLSALSSQAVPPHPELVDRLKAEGKWKEFTTRYKDRKEKLDFSHPNPYRVSVPFYGRVAAGQVPPDTLKVVVIYAAPSDRPTSADGVNVTQAQLQTILFGANPTRNMTDYYKEVSYGQTVVVGTVYGPYTLPETNAYYAGNDFGQGSYPNNAQKFVQDAIDAADPFVDFSQFDANGNGAVDGLFVIHSGPGGEQTGNPNDIWSHAYTIPSTLRDGTSLSLYSIEPEQQGSSPVQIGVFCHEAGHALFGLPDLYDTDYSSSGLGWWDLMAGGNYLNGSRTPAHMSAWCKKQVGWLSPIRLMTNQTGVSIPTSQFNPVVYRLWKHGNTGLEYFLVETRSKRGFDSFLPGSGGLFIWHIDEGVANNNGEPRYRVGLEQADGLLHLENNLGWGDGGDPFPGTSNNRNFSENSNPNSISHNLQPSQVAVTNISDVDSVMSADLQVTYIQPYIVLDKAGFIFSAVYKGAPPAARTVNVTNDGGGVLNWTADWNRPAGWLSVTPDTATAPTAATVSIASTNVTPGVAHIDTISIGSPDALNGPLKMWVNFQTYSVRGDLTRDGIVTPADVATLLNCVFLNPNGPNCELLVADSNCDGGLTPADIGLLLLAVFAFRPLPC